MRLKKDNARVAARASVDALVATMGGDAKWRTLLIV